MEQFAGFTNSQFKTILNKLGYESNSLQTDEVNAFLAANPNASAKLGQYTMIARQMVSNKGRSRRGFSNGGMTEQEGLDLLKQIGPTISGDSGDYSDIDSFRTYNFSNSPFTFEDLERALKAAGFGKKDKKSSDMNIKSGA